MLGLLKVMGQNIVMPGTLLLEAGIAGIKKLRQRFRDLHYMPSFIHQTEESSSSQ